jgi:hypothetical protein
MEKDKPRQPQGVVGVGCEGEAASRILRDNLVGNFGRQLR